VMVEFPVPYSGVCVLPGLRREEACVLVAKVALEVPAFESGALAVAGRWRRGGAETVFLRGPDGDLLCPLVHPGPGAPDAGLPAPGMGPEEVERDGFGGTAWEMRRGEGAWAAANAGLSPVRRGRAIAALLRDRHQWPFAPEGLASGRLACRSGQVGPNILPEQGPLRFGGEAKTGARDAAIARAADLASRCALVAGRLFAPGWGPLLRLKVRHGPGWFSSLDLQPNRWFGPHSGDGATGAAAWRHTIPWALRADARAALRRIGCDVRSATPDEEVVWDPADDALGGGLGAAEALRRACLDAAERLVFSTASVFANNPRQGDLQDASLAARAARGAGDAAALRAAEDGMLEAAASLVWAASPANLRGHNATALWAPLVWGNRPDLGDLVAAAPGASPAGTSP